jgi:hypothetical protein
LKQQTLLVYLFSYVWFICITALPVKPVHWSLITQEYLIKNSISVLPQLPIQQTQPLPVTVAKNDCLFEGMQGDEEVRVTMLLTMTEISERAHRSAVVWPLAKISNGRRELH